MTGADNMKRNLIILLIVLILIVAAFITFFWVKSYLENSLNDLVNTQIEDVDMSKVGDGKHYGSFSFRSRWLLPSTAIE